MPAVRPPHRFAYHNPAVAAGAVAAAGLDLLIFI